MLGEGIAARFNARIRAWVPLGAWAAVLVQTAFLIALALSDSYDVARRGEVLRVLLTYATLLALFVLIHVLVASRRWARRLTFVLFFAFVAVNFARYETAGSFDYGFVHENIRELGTPLGRHIVAANVQPWEVGVLFLLPLAAGFALLRGRAETWPGSRRARRLVSVACTAVLVLLPVARISTHESLTSFAVSAFRFHAEARAAAATIDGAPFPFVRESVPSARAIALGGGQDPRPHVIILFLESWSARYDDAARPDGRSITPVFDARRREGLTYDHFYGNSVQSSRGHFATLCSLIPLYRAKEFIDIPDTRLHCLPQVMREHGYRTSFHSATDDPDFDYADRYFARIGFDDVRFAPSRKLTPDPAMWGMGVQDDVFYERVFSLLDAKLAREPGAPQLAVLANASNHYPFDASPTHVAAPGYKTKAGRNYVASLSAADAWLAAFFTELERRPAFRDALVVLVGDHSFPADEHGIHLNGVGAYEEAFHTGFALRWPGHVPPQVVGDRAASQIDIAPTLIDLLQLRTRVHFTGRSLIAEEPSRPPPVPLIQPYDGVRLAAVRWPFKLVRHESAQQESLYDLSADPAEERDRLEDPALADELGPLRDALVRIHASEAILRANRVWPKSP